LSSIPTYVFQRLEFGVVYGIICTRIRVSVFRRFPCPGFMKIAVKMKDMSTEFQNPRGLRNDQNRYRRLARPQPARGQFSPGSAWTSRSRGISGLELGPRGNVLHAEQVVAPVCWAGGVKPKSPADDRLH